MFTDELTVYLQAGDGGDGVVRWRHEKFKPLAGPAGGNGGNGGSIYLRAVPDLNRLSKYVGQPSFIAESGESGRSLSQHGHNGDDLYIDIPVGSIVHDRERDRTYSLLAVGQVECVLRGGRGGRGNEHFKSSTNRSPQESTHGKAGERGDFFIEVALMVDAGFVGMPNAGKSSLLNSLTNAQAKVGDYPFTTVSPHLGDLYGCTLADIPGLIAGAATGKGLGHRFLRHITRTKMLLHVVSLASATPKEDYYTIRDELKMYDSSLVEKDEWVVLSQSDTVKQDQIEYWKKEFDKINNRVFVTSVYDPESIKQLSDALVASIRST